MFYAPKGTKFYRGDEVVLRGVAPEIPKNMKNFDYNLYLKAKGVFLTVFAPREKIEVTKEGRGFLRFFGILRDRIIENNNNCLLYTSAIPILRHSNRFHSEKIRLILVSAV